MAEGKESSSDHASRACTSPRTCSRRSPRRRSGSIAPSPGSCRELGRAPARDEEAAFVRPVRAPTRAAVGDDGIEIKHIVVKIRVVVQAYWISDKVFEGG